MAESRPRTEWTPGSAREGLRGADFPGLGAKPRLSAQIQKRHSGGSASEDRLAACAREHIKSLHQNSRTPLLYGKNNVLVQPVRELDAHSPLPLLKGSGQDFPSHICPLPQSLTREKGEKGPTPHFTVSYALCPALSWQKPT